MQQRKALCVKIDFYITLAGIMAKRSGPAESIIWGVLAAVGITVAGFAMGLKKLVWALWVVVSIIWVLFWLSAGKGARGDAELLYLLITWGPPILVFLVVRLLAGIVDAMFAPLAAEGARSRGQQETIQPPEPSEHSAASWHDTLEVSVDASVDEIRGAYRSLIGQYHPDKVATLGAELRAVADRKSKELNAAYEAALKQRGVEV